MRIAHPCRCAGLAQQRLPAVTPAVSRSRGGPARAADLEPLEVLRQENEVLKQTIGEAKDAVQALEAELRGAGIAVPTSGSGEAGAMQPEDFWSPMLDVPEGHAFIEEYGKISPVPGHDGTECFKWDNTLWGSEGHFRVRHGYMGAWVGRPGQALHQWSMGPPNHALLTLGLKGSSCGARSRLSRSHGSSRRDAPAKPPTHGDARGVPLGALPAPTCHAPGPLPVHAPSQYRWDLFRKIRSAIDNNEGGLEKFSQGERGPCMGSGRLAHPAPCPLCASRLHALPQHAEHEACATGA